MDKAMNLIPAPQWTEDQMQEYFDTTIRLALKYGLTSIHDADTNARFIAFYRKYAFFFGTIPSFRPLSFSFALPNSLD
jgi:hypothetical protein